MFVILKRMALIEFTDGRKKIISAWQGEHIWQILNSEIDAKPNEVEYCSKVKMVYLNRHNATTPRSYIERYKHLFPDDRPVARTDVTVFPGARKI